jgi:CDP-diacylglycerol---glycerol-3-phosphate 3-phosphatidyltransferase
VPESSPGVGGEQGGASSRGFTAADALTVSRLPLAAAFVALPDPRWRLAVLAVASASDLLDGFLARRMGGSRYGALLDPVADKLFMLAAFSVVVFSGRLALYEIAGVLLRDLIAAIAFVAVGISGRPAAIPARLGGKAVTIGQVLTLAAFLADSPLLRPLAWATAAIGLYAIWDYGRVAARERQRF